MSRTTHSTSKRDTIGSVRSTFSAKVREGSYLPPARKRREADGQSHLCHPADVAIFPDIERTNRVAGSNHGAPGLQRCDDAGFGDGNALLLHGFVNACPVGVVHLGDKEGETVKQVFLTSSHTGDVTHVTRGVKTI